MIELIAMPWSEYEALRNANANLDLTEVEPSMDEFSYEMRHGYIASGARESRHVYRAALPRSAAVALLSEEIYCRLAGLSELELSFGTLDDFTR